MKTTKLILLLMILFFSCNNNTTKELTSKKSLKSTVSNTILKKQNACEVLPISTIADLLQVDSNLLLKQDMSFGEKRSICYYYTKQGDKKFFIRMAWENKKAQENKRLQNKFTLYLNQGEKDINSYEEIEKTKDHQILFGIGQDRENKYIHILRKRFGNQAELQLEVTQVQKNENLKNRLQKFLKEIE